MFQKLRNAIVGGQGVPASMQAASMALNLLKDGTNLRRGNDETEQFCTEGLIVDFKD